jgi:hypothetical protein
MKVVIRGLAWKWRGDAYRDSESGKIVVTGFWFPHLRSSRLTLGLSRGPLHCAQNNCAVRGCTALFSEGTPAFESLGKLLAGEVRKVVLHVKDDPTASQNPPLNKRVIEFPKTSLERIEDRLERENLHRLRENSQT